MKIAENLYFIQRGWLNCNHFVFNGFPKALIDTGYKRDLAVTLELIRETGVEPADVELIISTHSHCDHIGGNRYIQELSGCDIAMHSIDKHFIDTRNDWFTWWRYYEQEGDFFNVTRELQEGDVLELGGHELVVLHTPGHASGQISLYVRGERFLISADAVWDGDFGAFTPRIEGNISPFLQQQTLEKLSAMDLEMIYPGHGPPVTDPQSAIDRARKRLEKFLEKPELMGLDQLKKLFLYELLKENGYEEELFFQHLMRTLWYRETVDLYFQGDYRSAYENALERLLHRGLAERRYGRLLARVRA